VSAKGLGITEESSWKVKKVGVHTSDSLKADGPSFWQLETEKRHFLGVGPKTVIFAKMAILTPPPKKGDISVPP
jgi:hypothetical protein